MINYWNARVHNLQSDVDFSLAESPQIPHEGQVKEPESTGGQQIPTSSLGGGQGLFSWISGNSLVNRVVEKTKVSYCRLNGLVLISV